MTDASPKEFCANHPSIETSLHCNKCGKPICARCAVLTPTGYRCKECIKEQHRIFETAKWSDYPLIFIVVGFLSFLGSVLGAWLSARFGFYIIILAVFLAPALGGGIAEIARKVTGRRRSKNLFILAAIAAILGCVPISLQLLLNFSVFGLIFQVMYAVLMTSTLYYRLGGIKIG